MKSKCRQLLIIMAGFILIFTTKALAKQVQTTQEKRFAVVTKGKINKKKLKKDNTLKFNFTIKDEGIEKVGDEYIQDLFSTGKEYREILVVWQSSKKQSIQKIYSGKYNKKTKQFKISDKIKIPKGMQAGKWRLSRIVIYSGGIYSEDDSESVGIYNSNMKWTQESYLDKTNEFVDLSFGDFEVRGTGKKLDKKGPSISAKTLKLSKKLLKTGTKSRFSVKISDESNMLYRVLCQWVSYGSEIYGEGGDETLYEMKYNKKKKMFECNVQMFQNEKKARLRNIILEDCYGNKRYYYWSNEGGKEKIETYGYDFNEKYKTYSLKKKDKKALKEMMITRKKKYIKG